MNPDFIHHKINKGNRALAGETRLAEKSREFVKPM
jgi:hypothetical protein